MAKAQTYAEAYEITADEVSSSTPVVAYLTITKVIREHVELKYGPKGDTLGMQLDSLLAKAASEGDEIQQVAFEIPDTMWQKYVEAAQTNKRY